MMTGGRGHGGAIVADPPIPTGHTAAPASQVAATRAVLVTIATALAGAVVLCAAAVGVGLLLTRELLHGAIGRWDVDVTQWLVARRTPSRDDLSSIGSDLAGTATVVVVVVVVLGLLAWRRHWRELGIVAVALAVEGVTYATATYVVTRHRPRVARLEDLIVADSYFSGHVAASGALYGSLAVIVWWLTRHRALRATVVVVAVLLPTIVALSRMYRGMHFSSDAIVGALVGAGSVTVAVIAVTAGARAAVGTPVDERRRRRRRRASSPHGRCRDRVMAGVAVIAHLGKQFGGGLGELRSLLDEYGVTDPMWFEVAEEQARAEAGAAGHR